MYDEGKHQESLDLIFHYDLLKPLSLTPRQENTWNRSKPYRSNNTNNDAFVEVAVRWTKAKNIKNYTAAFRLFSDECVSEYNLGWNGEALKGLRNKYLKRMKESETVTPLKKEEFSGLLPTY